MIDSPVMAKKRTEAGGGEPSRRSTVLTIRGTDEWREWLERAARHSRMTVSTFVDLAVAKLASENGFAEPPPQR